MVVLRAAHFPDDAALVRELFREYAAELNVDLCFQGFEQELAGLPGRYAPPSGGLWLATVDNHTAGCVALRGLDAERCEMKRLYVRPAFRRGGVGRALAERTLAAAAESGYRLLLLDTLSHMHEAIALYRSLGFREVEPYCHNPLATAVYLGRGL
jgi:ribosomal protein S18 acetylase RimI-like enzyme